MQVNLFSENNFRVFQTFSRSNLEVKLNVVLANSFLFKVKLFSPDSVTQLLKIINQIFLGPKKLFWDGLFGGHLDRCPFLDYVSA
jgi:hypothetical protein